MNHPPLRPLQLMASAALAVLMAACGGTGPDIYAAVDGRAQALAAAPTVIPPLFDDTGHVMPSSPWAAPADTGARTRRGLYATQAQARQLEDAMGTQVIPVNVEPGPDAAAAVELATQMVWGHQVAHDLSAEVPVLVRSSDLRLGATTVHHLEAQGYPRVFLVTH
jgi:hypothetical protein